MKDMSSPIQINRKTSIKQFAEKVFCHVVLNNLRNGPWRALPACANFSLETQVYNQNYKDGF